MARDEVFHNISSHFGKTLDICHIMTTTTMAASRKKNGSWLKNDGVMF